MKYRDGFVANSSSTSYVVYGWYVDSDKLFNIAKEVFNCTEEEWDDYKYDYLYELGEKNQIEIGNKKYDTVIANGYDIFVGINIERMDGPRLNQLSSSSTAETLRMMYPFVEGDPSVHLSVTD